MTGEERSDDVQHCPSCHRPLPHTDAEQRACPDLMARLRASVDAARAARLAREDGGS